MKDFLPRPLDPFRSIKLKIGILVTASLAAAAIVFWYGVGWLPRYTLLTAMALALLVTQALAHGMTSPLRQMTAAAKAMARGDYSRRVRATSRDEVGDLARAFNQMAADLETADQQRRELIANVSHELRTPITAVQAVLENIVDGVAPPDRTTLRTALAQTERLGRLVTELLDLSRIDAGVQPLTRARFSVSHLIDEAIAEAEVAAAAGGREVGFAAATSPSDAYGFADRGRLHQVLTNLLDNAVRHSPDGGKILVTGRTDDAGLTIEVADEGPGISPEERTRVFERFTRGDRASGGGTGLGLAIARWIVELHHGDIAVVEPPFHNGQRGCTIRVTLPGESPRTPSRGAVV